MRKTIGLAMLPFALAITPLLAMAEQTHHMENVEKIQKQTTQQQQPVTKKTTETIKTEKQQIQQTKTTITPSTITADKQAAVQQSTDIQIKQQMLQGHKDLIDRHYAEAVKNFQNVLAIQPNNVNALHGLALSTYSQGNHAEALKTVDQAIAIDPLSSRLFFLKGHILEAQNKPTEALEAYLTFTAMDPNDAAALLAQRRVSELYKLVEPKLTQSQKTYYDGLYMLSLQQPEAAIPLFEKYHTMEPNNSQADLLMGQSYLQLSQPDKALPHLEAAIKLKSNSPVAYYRLGSVYEMQGETDNAKEAYRKLLEFAPQSEAAMIISRRMEIKQ